MIIAVDCSAAKLAAREVAAAAAAAAAAVRVPTGEVSWDRFWVASLEMDWVVKDGVAAGVSWSIWYSADICVGSRSLGLYDVAASGLC